MRSTFKLLFYINRNLSLIHILKDENRVKTVRKITAIE